MGAMVFGFLQRSASLYGTGNGSVRCLGATSDTAVRLNRILSKHFCLAVADESYIKLTNLQSVEAIQERMQGWDAIILGNDLTVTQRPCTANTFETSPNEKTWEIYWELKSNADADEKSGEISTAKSHILSNVLQAAKFAKIQHIVAVDSSPDQSLESQLSQCGLPFTCIQPVGQLIQVPDYTFRKGVVGELSVQPSLSETMSRVNDNNQLAEEDIAALCVQVLQSLDWTTSRSLQVSCSGPVEVNEPVVKRPDQEWCVESRKLESSLASIVQ
jgi:hypothetical protein